MSAPLRAVAARLIGTAQLTGTALSTGTALVTAAALCAGCASSSPVAVTSDVGTASARSATAPAPALAPAPAASTPATSVPAAPVPAAPVRDAAPVVVLDPGHNGGNARAAAAINRKVPDGRGGRKPCNTTGTSTDDGYPEHAFNWDLARRVRAQLEEKGVTVVLTRPDDRGVGPCVDQRGAAGEKAGAAAAVSLHADGAAATARGFHVAYSDPPLGAAQSGPARTLATDLRDAMRQGRFAPAGYIGENGLDGRDDLAGLNTATVPTALVECANMRNPAEAELVSTPAGRDRYATAITTGILRFLGR